MAITLDGTSGVTTPGVVNTAAETIATTLAVTGAVTLSSTLKTATTIGVGAATPSASGAGITFPATASASTDSNTLDDYEEGTWTPALVGSTSGSAASYSSRTGTYTKIGNTVVAYMAIDVLSSTGIVGNVYISGLPFNLTGSNPGTAISYINTFGVNVVACGVRTANSTQLLLEYRTAAAQDNTLYAAASLPASGPDFIVTITYSV